MTRDELTAKEEPKNGDIPALAGLTLGVGAVVGVMIGLPWQIILAAGVLAGLTGLLALVRAGMVRGNRFARLSGWSGGTG